MNGMNSHSNGDASWHREMRERKALENAAYRKGQEDMHTVMREAWEDSDWLLISNALAEGVKDYGC